MSREKVDLNSLPGGTLFIYDDEEYLKLDSPAQYDGENSSRQAVCTRDGRLVFPTCENPLVYPLRMGY